MARPTSWLGISAQPVARIDSSTRWASWASASSSTGRPWQARLTPLMTFSRLNGSVTPERLTTASTASSTVVNRRLQCEHDRRRRMAWPSSTSRESTTRESELRQNGHRTGLIPPLGHTSMTPRRAGPGDQHVDHRWITCPPSEPNLWTNHSGVTTRCWGQPYVEPQYFASRHGGNRRFEGTVRRDVACRARPPTERAHTTATCDNPRT